MEREYIYTIQSHDIGRKRLPLDRKDFDKQVYIGEWLGAVKSEHIGRRIYIRNGRYEIESKAQYSQRTGGRF